MAVRFMSGTAWESETFVGLGQLRRALLTTTHSTRFAASNNVIWLLLYLLAIPAGSLYRALPEPDCQVGIRRL